MIELVGGPRNHLLWVVRHGESTWDAIGRMQREIAHPPLTARGTTQAYAAGYALRHKRIDRIVCSDAVRARQTAQAIATVLGVPTTVDGRLRERGWRRTGTLTDADSHRQTQLEDPTERVRTVLLDLAAMDGSTAVVTHGDIVCAILDMLHARDATTRQWRTGTDVPNGSVVGINLRRLSRFVDLA
jgi:broad specificity phosphatase PhoE